MSVRSLLREVGSLIEHLHVGRLMPLGVIPWASPVISFGNPAACKVATLGLNPSNLEFVDNFGKRLVAPHHRFESLDTLQARDWGRVANRDIEKVWYACEDYFWRNPYDRWFKRLEKILVGTGASYYSRIGDSACHLDLVPYATAMKWSELSVDQRAGLIDVGVPSLVRTIGSSSIRVIVLNGMSVVKEFGRLIGGRGLEARIMPQWGLQSGRVSGVSYTGLVSKLGGIELDRELIVLGYNHNIQSSFGVTGEVVERIAKWVTIKSSKAMA